MTHTLMCSMPNGRAWSTVGITCHAAALLGATDRVHTGAVGYSPFTATKRNTPGVLTRGLT